VFDRTIGNFLREDFTLVLMFGSLAFFLYSLSDGNRRRAVTFSVLSGALLFLALGSWHLTQFYFLLFSVGVALWAMLREDRERLLRSFGVLTLFAVLAGLAFPVLRSRLFFLSHPLVISYALLLAGLLARRRGLSRRGFASAFVPLSIAAAVVVWILTRGYLEYSHVYSLMLEKLRHLGVKPAQPSALSYDGRVFWQGPFESPTPVSVLFYFGHIFPALLLPLAGLTREALRKRFTSEGCLAIFLILSFFVLYLFIERMAVFLVFFACCVAGGAVLVKGRTVRIAALVLLIGGLAVGAWEVSGYKTRTGVVSWYAKTLELAQSPALLSTAADKDELTEWILAHSDSSDVFLTWMAEGPDVLTATGRPVNLHSMFESQEIRRKNHEFITALYSDEETFYRVFTKFDSDYFVYRGDFVLDTSKESERYIADALKLARSSAAFKFHFSPDSLAHFVCVYENRFYRVFALKGPGVLPASAGKHSAFDVSVFEPRGPAGEYLDDSGLPEVLKRLEGAMLEFFRGVERRNLGNPDEAYAYFRRAVGVDPGLKEAWFAMAEISIMRQDLDRAEIELQQCLRLEPVNAPALANLGTLYLAQGRLKDGVPLLERAVELAPQNAVLRFNLAEALAALERLDEAARHYEEAIRLDPTLEPAYVSLGRVYALQLRSEDAIAMWRKALELNPYNSEAAAMLQHALEFARGER
ncbi:MAG: tetratricopeptide repeat protein, partial [Candidatus Eisenbacteria bacterium]